MSWAPAEPEIPICELCGAKGGDVGPGLARFRDPAQPFQAIARCRDAAACRRRIEAAGSSWPLAEVAP